MIMALDGVRVLDWTMFQLGPAATSMLGDLGADVIKIEQPTVGDGSRGMKSVGGLKFSMPQGRNFMFETNNRSKRGIAIDVSKDEGQKIVHRLTETADVFVSNFRESTARKLRLDYETLSKINKRLVYACGSAYGPDGPDRDKPGYDPVAQARSGFMMMVGEEGMPPVFAHSPIADQVGAICLGYGIVIALLARERSGVGQKVDVSILGSMIAAMQFDVAARVMLGSEFPRYKRSRAWNPLYLYYECADGKWIQLGMVSSDRSWSDFCKLVGIEQLRDDPKFSSADVRGVNCEELVAVLDRVFSTRPRDEWMKIFDEALVRGVEIVHSVVNTVSDLPDDPQVVSNSLVVSFAHPVFGEIKMAGLPFKFSETPWVAGGMMRREAPELGQHTEEVLLEVGYSWEDIAGFKERDVI